MNKLSEGCCKTHQISEKIKNVVVTDGLFLYTLYLHNGTFKIKVSRSCPKWNVFSYLTCESDQYLRSSGRNETRALQVAVKEHFPSAVEIFSVVM
jgi:hypothetical protein